MIATRTNPDGPSLASVRLGGAGSHAWRAPRSLVFAATALALAGCGSEPAAEPSACGASVTRPRASARLLTIGALGLALL